MGRDSVSGVKVATKGGKEGKGEEGKGGGGGRWLCELVAGNIKK